MLPAVVSPSPLYFQGSTPQFFSDIFVNFATFAKNKKKSAQSLEQSILSYLINKGHSR